VSNRVTDYWDIDGTSLDTHAWGRSVWETGQAPPLSRGTDLIVPNRIGSVARTRVPAARTLSIPMWVSGVTDVDGDIFGTTIEAQFETNWALIRAAMYGGGRAVSITKRWNSGATSATATGYFAGGLELSNIGDRQGARFTCDYELPDPWFYSSSTDNDTFSDGSTDPTWSGTARTPHYTVKFTSTTTWVNPTIAAKIGSTTISSLTYTGTITSSKYVQVALPSLTFTTDDTGQSIDNFTHTEHEWVAVDPDVSAVVLSDSGGSGTCTITYTPAWI
jgi:hypothetical protein